HRLYVHTHIVKTKGFSLDLCVCTSLFIQSENTTHVFEPNTILAAIPTSLSGSFFCSGLSFEMSALSQRTRVGRAVKQTQ
ncbi:unnamed protein product, partial [Brassica oleracea]